MIAAQLGTAAKRSHLRYFAAGDGLGRIIRCSEFTPPARAVTAVPPRWARPMFNPPSARAKKLILIGVINFLTFVCISLAIGGGVLGGKIEQGHYYLAQQNSKLTEVPQAVWVYSFIHGISNVITLPLCAIGMMLVARDRQLNQKNTVTAVPPVGRSNQSMKITCPSCSTQLPPDQLNVETDVAICSRCNEAFSISALVAAGQVSGTFNFSDSPRGTWYSETFAGWTIGATTRSSSAFLLVPFMCVWSGGSLGGIYGTQIVEGKFNLVMSLFGIPFVLGTLLFGSIAIMSVCGKTTVTVEGNAGRLFVGVGPIGWARRFDWYSINCVEEDHLGHSHEFLISLVGKTRMKLGWMLTEPRRSFLLQGLRKQLASRPTGHGRRAESPSL